jgi:GDP-L-fucose synthase
MVGQAFLRLLASERYDRILTASRKECDLTDAQQVAHLFESRRPEYVFHFAAKVGGIKANVEHPADFLLENLLIQTNVIRQCYMSGVTKLIFLGSSCVYPRECPQPMKEEYILTGPLEPTNEAYALAKLAGLRLGQYFSKQYGMRCINPMPCNLYGPNDSFDLDRSHVLSALVRRFVDAQQAGAKEVTLWGTGTPRREFMHVDDLAAALLFLAINYESPEVINVGAGTDISISELASLVAKIVGFTGEIRWNSTMPDGMPRKCLDVSRLHSQGFRHKIDLREGVQGVVEHYRASISQGQTS